MNKTRMAFVAHLSTLLLVPFMSKLVITYVMSIACEDSRKIIFGTDFASKTSKYTSRSKCVFCYLFYVICLDIFFDLLRKGNSFDSKVIAFLQIKCWLLSKIVTV